MDERKLKVVEGLVIEQARILCHDVGITVQIVVGDERVSYQAEMDLRRHHSVDRLWALMSLLRAKTFLHLRNTYVDVEVDDEGLMHGIRLSSDYEETPGGGPWFGLD